MNGLIWLYRLLIRPVFEIGLFMASFTHSKFRKIYYLRKEALKHLSGFKPIPGAKILWIHCASGEFEYAKPVIRALRENHAKTSQNLKNSRELQIVVTYFSSTFVTHITKFNGIDHALPLPWDRPKEIKIFLAYLKPNALLIARTDLWPELLWQTQRAKIPILLFSSTLSSQSSKLKSPLAKIYARWIYSFLSHIYCVSPEDQSNFENLGLASVTALGDTRYDQVIHRLKNPKSLRDHLKPQRREHTLICGSTWPRDEEILFGTLGKMSRKIQVVLAPHEPTESHLKNIEMSLSQLRIPFSRYSTSSTWSPGEVLLIDQVGILAELYTWGSVAFVGGSFNGSVHSVMEPLAAGCLTVVGPDFQNNREAIEFSLRPESFVLVSSTPKDLDVTFKRAFERVSGVASVKLQKNNMKKNPPTVGTISEQIQHEVLKRGGASQKLVEIVEQLLVFQKS